MNKKFIKQPLNGITVADSAVGIRTPNILMGEHAGEYVRGDIMDANAVIQAFDELKGNVDTNHDTLEELVNEIHANTDGINEEKTRAQNKEKEISDKLAIVDGDSNTEGSFRKAIADVIAAAPEDLDTLKEIADKLADNDDLHTALNQAIATKANTSDVLLKKSASGGYYIEENSNELGQCAFAANSVCTASGKFSHAEGMNTTASGQSSHAEGAGTMASGYCSHAQGINNVDDKNAIYSVGIGNTTTRKNAEYIYAKNSENGFGLTDDPKNGYKYLIGVGGYDGISTDNTTYKSIQEVIADLTSRIEQLETKVKALEAANTPA